MDLGQVHKSCIMHSTGHIAKLHVQIKDDYLHQRTNITKENTSRKVLLQHEAQPRGWEIKHELAKN